MIGEFIAPRGDRILVTGSSSFIGAKVVEILLEYGFSNRQSTAARHVADSVLAIDGRSNE
jgi:nucleoside-diphosphate-sugar epimerase